MTNESIRDHCLSLPHATEIVQWGDHLLFKVGGKMFAIIDLEGHSCSLKCTPDTYAELVEMEDIVPAGHNMWTRARGRARCPVASSKRRRRSGRRTASRRRRRS